MLVTQFWEGQARLPSQGLQQSMPYVNGPGCTSLYAFGPVVSLVQGLEKNFDYKKVLKAFKKGGLPSQQTP